MSNMDSESNTPTWDELLRKIAEYTPTEVNPSEIDCPLCEDGWIREEIDGYRYAKKCACMVAREAAGRIKRSGLGRIIEEWTLDAFKIDQPHQKVMKETAERFIAAIERKEKPWLFMGGAVGSGKSHLCTAVCGELLKTNHNVRYFQWLTESRKLKGYAADPDEYQEVLYKFINVEILYIDDLFKSKRNNQAWLNPSDADIRLAFEIINQRYYEDKVTIISAEWMLMDDLLPIDEGTFSRVYEKSKGYKAEIKREQSRNYRLRG